MRPQLLLPFLLATAAFAQDSTDPKQKALAAAQQNAVTLELDLPYADNENPKQALDLYLPKKPATEKPLPVIAFIHGGGWVNGDRIGYSAACIQMARTGDYAAVGVGYRLSKEASWPAQIQDCKAAIRWIRGHAKKYNLDPDRIIVWGSSAGGHLSSLLGTSGDVKELEGSLGSFSSLSSRVHCVVNLCGPQDFTQALMFDSKNQPIFKDDAVTGLLGGPAPEKPDIAKAASPITYITPDDSPFITFHGTADQRVAYRHAETLHAALQKAGVTSLLIPITGGGHSSVSHPDVKKRAEPFVAKYLRGIDSPIDISPIEALPAK
jgi:acetyl esterase/lipase